MSSPPSPTTNSANRHLTSDSTAEEPPVFITHFVAIHGRHSFAYYAALLSFYLHFIILTPVAHLLNRSYLLRHPNRPLPVPIAPRSHHIIHSFHPTPDVHNYLTWRFPRLQLPRTWMTGEEMETDIEPRLGTIRLIALDGELQGPLLQQGMVFYQGGQSFFIEEELGRLPCRADLITTHTIALDQDVQFYLNIPAQFIDLHGLLSERAQRPFQETVSLRQLMQARDRPLPRPRSQPNV